MIKLKAFSLFFILFSTTLFSQKILKGIVVLNDNIESSLEVNIYEKTNGFLSKVRTNEQFELELFSSSAELIFVSDGFPSIKKLIDFNKNENPFLRVELKVEELSEVILSAKRREVFLLKRMDDFEKKEIYAGK